VSDRITGTPWGLITLGVIGILSLAAVGAWTYVRLARTSVLRDTWPGPSATELFATIDHTAPWSEPWTKLCRIDATTHAERWCRSVPDGAAVRDVHVEGDDVVAGIGDGVWHLDLATGATID
jgi:hypothetical protein